MTQLDSNAAWKEATAIIGANREVLLVLAGVFFFLPGLLMAIVMGEPDVQSGADFEQAKAALEAFYAQAWWAIILVGVIQTVGVLAMLTLMRDRSRPTVGEAIRQGFTGLLPYFLAQILFGLVASLAALVAGAIIALATAIGIAPLAVVLVLLLIGALIYAMIRLILLAPVIAVEQQTSPIAALRRSWALTKGNFWRIFAFFALVVLLAAVALSIVMMIVGALLALIASAETARVLGAAVSGALTAMMVIYLIGMLAAVHRQLAGPSGERLSETFE